jgi:CspA family cold shock protein
VTAVVPVFGPSPGPIPDAGSSGSTYERPIVKAQRREKKMPNGTVKFFNAEKGYGFLSRGDGEDVFVHYTNIEGSGFRTLETGQEVEFEIAPGRKGDEARNVKVV